MITRSKSGIFKPKIYTAQMNEVEPASHDQAIKHEKWKKAMDEEFNALVRNRTFKIILMTLRDASEVKRTRCSCKGSRFGL